MDIIKFLIPQIHREGFIFIIAFLFVTVVLSYFSSFLGALGLILSLWCVYFFRDPSRVVPVDPNLIISPADGMVELIAEVMPPKNLEMKQELVTRVSIFLNVFNVHVNRVPFSGKIKKLYYHEGQFLNASLDKASDLNERQEVLLETDNGQEIAFTQIAGLVARRILCDLKEGQQVQAGERFGIIRFGSRMDVYLPKGIKPLVQVGQTMIGGESIIADFTKSSGREGQVR